MTTMPTTEVQDHVQLAPKRQGGSWLWGDFRAFKEDPLTFFRDIARSNAPVMHTRFVYVPLYVINTPEAVKYVLQTNNKNYIKDQRFMRVIEDGGEPTLFTTDGDDWLWRRRLMQPMFRRTVIQNFGQIMAEEIKALVERWSAVPGGVIEVEDEMMNLTMQIIGRAMFSVDIMQNAPKLHHAYNYIGPHIIYRMSTLWAPPLAVPTPSNRKFLRETEHVKAFLGQIIDERRQDGALRHDLLDMLLVARDEEADRSFSESELIMEMSGVVFAGHETTAATLTWALALLAQHPEIQKKLQAEIDQALPHGRLPTMDDLPNLPYARMVIDEALRLYPPAYTTARQTVEEDVVEGFYIPGDTAVNINIYGLHMHPNYWDAPDEFRPERFSPEGLKKQTKYAYLPFLTGPRRCIGEHFALTEAHMALASIVQRFELSLAQGFPTPEAKFAVRTAEGAHLRLSRR